METLQFGTKRFSSCVTRGSSASINHQRVCHQYLSKLTSQRVRGLILVTRTSYMLRWADCTSHRQDERIYDGQMIVRTAGRADLSDVECLPVASIDTLVVFFSTRPLGSRWMLHRETLTRFMGAASLAKFQPWLPPRDATADHFFVVPRAG